MVSEQEHLANAAKAHDLRVRADYINSASVMLNLLQRAKRLNPDEYMILYRGVNASLEIVSIELNKMIGAET